jgi:hypothetical protein
LHLINYQLKRKLLAVNGKLTFTSIQINNLK